MPKKTKSDETVVESNKQLLSWLYSACMFVDKPGFADVLLLNMLDSAALISPKQKRQELFDTIRSNLAYMAGYQSHETRLRVEKLFYCVHPVFGPAIKGEITPRQAFNMGIQMGRRSKAGKSSRPFARFKQPVLSPMVFRYFFPYDRS